MKNVLIWFSIPTLMLLAACGSSPEATPGGDGAAAVETDASAFTVTVTGAETTELAGSGRVVCFTDIGDGELELSVNGGMSNNVLINMPRGIVPGTYPFDTMGIPGESVAINYIGENMMEDDYEADPDGSLTLSAVPTTSGEQMAGSFEVVLANSDTGETVTLDGEFDFIAAESAFFAECDAS